MTEVSRTRKPVKKRILDALESAKPWLARDIAVGVISHRYDEELYRLAGRAHAALGELPCPGLYYILTTDTSEEAQQAVQAAIDEFGADLPTHVRLYVYWECLPAAIQARLEDCFARASAPPIAAAFSKRFRKSQARPRTVRNTLVGLGCGLLLLLAVIAFFVGLISVGGFVLGMLRRLFG